MRRLLGAVVFAGAVMGVMGAAAWVARQVVQGPEARFAAVAAGLTPEMPAAEVAARVAVERGVRLSAKSVEVWRKLVAQGMKKDLALYVVSAYQQAAE